MEETLNLFEPIFFARVTEEIPLVATLVDWREAVSYYPEDMLGGEADREDGHNENTCCLFVYPSYDAIENCEYVPIWLFDELLKNNPMYMISNKETERMKKLERERITYVLEAAKNPENKILIKIGLVMEEEYWEKKDINVQILKFKQLQQRD